MSMPETIKVVCPECGSEHNFTIWRTLNAELNPDEKDALINGTLFVFVCPNCGHRTGFDYPILFHNMTQQTMIYYIPEIDIEEIESRFRDMMSVVEMRGYRTRVVDSLNSLREKALIFDLGLDDRVVEIIKFLYAVTVQVEYPDEEFSDVLFTRDVEEGGYAFCFLGNRNIYAKLSMEEYKVYHQEYKPLFNESDDNAMIVDFQWAEEFIQREILNK